MLPHHLCGDHFGSSFCLCLDYRADVVSMLTPHTPHLCIHTYWLNQSVLVEPLLLLLLLLCACTCVRTYVCALCVKCQNRYVTFQVPCPSLLPTSQPLCGKMRPSSVCTMLLLRPHLPRTHPLLLHQSRLCPMQQSRHSPSTDLLRKRRRMTKITLFPRLLTCSGM